MPQPQSWEFLIQQEGDRAWLPIDAPTVEILEGRYRIAAKSTLKNTPVEVQIVHDALDEDPPVRRTQKRSQQTNPSGLLAVIPYTLLNPGRWTLICAGEDWKKAVQIHILHQEVQEEWEPDWDLDSSESSVAQPAPVQAGSIAPPERVAEITTFVPAQPEGDALAKPEAIAKEDAPVPVGASVEDVLHHYTQMSEDMADQVLSEYDLLPEPDQPQPDVAPVISQPLPPLAIALEQDNFVARRGDTIVLSGEIAPAETELEAPTRLVHAAVRVILRDPQTSEVLLETEESIQDQQLPTDLTYWVTIPSNLTTRLVLGEILLQDLTEAEPKLLATQPFSLTADLAELLETIAENRTIAEDVVADKVEIPPSEALSLTFLDFVDTAKPIQARPLDPSAERALPPLLSVPTAGASLDLPDFSGKAKPQESPTEETTSLDLPDFSVQPEVPELSIADEVTTPEDEPLDVQDRFVDRATTLADDVDQAIAVEEPLSLPELDEEDDLLTPSEMLLYKDANPALYEFVVDDEPIVPIAHLAIARKPRIPSEAPIKNPFLIPEDQPIPTPTLEISKAELTAGESVEVRVKLPDLRPKIYVKLWISDRQSRIVLEEPRWLVDFMPNGYGELETSARLTVPQGSIEIEVEAIAVEMASQRQSHKVNLERSVTPAEVSEIVLGEFS